MKAHQSSSSFIVILIVMSVFNLSLNVCAAHQDETAATLRGNTVVGQEERILGKGGNGGGGGGGGGNNKESPAPTPARTLAPTDPITPKPTPGTNSCGTRPPRPPGTTAPTTKAPTPPTAPNCTSEGGACGGKDGSSCCDGLKCQGKTKTCVAARRNLRVEEAKTFPFQTSAADARHRKLDQCIDPENDSCNVNDNPLVCPPDIPSDAEELYSIICNYNESGAQFVATVDPCKSESLFCCDDGFGGLYKPVGGCWGTNVQCCPKGYTKNLNGNGCIPLNCCDGDGDHKLLYCPNC